MATKYITKVTGREIIVRNAHRLRMESVHMGTVGECFYTSLLPNIY